MGPISTRESEFNMNGTGAPQAAKPERDFTLETEDVTAAANHDQPAPPHKDDVLVRSDRDAWQMNACLNLSRESDYGFRHGYRRAGFSLAEWVNNNGVEQDSLVFPIVHSYRHHVELMLKHLIRSGCSLLGREATSQETGTLRCHSLDRLWTAFMPILAAVSEASAMSPPPGDQLAGVESYIRQITAVDPGSDSFRYAYSRDGTPSIVQEITHLNLLVFANHMERLCDYLDGIDGCFTWYKDGLDEMCANL